MFCMHNKKKGIFFALRFHPLGTMEFHKELDWVWLARLGMSMEGIWLPDQFF